MTKDMVWGIVRAVLAAAGGYFVGAGILGGLGLLVVPELTLRLLLSNGSYGDVMPRLVGGRERSCCGRCFGRRSRRRYGAERRCRREQRNECERRER